MPPKAPPSTVAAVETRTAEPELDLVSFQLDLDESLAFAQALVRSWVPSKVDTTWALTTSDQNGGVNSLGPWTTNRSNRPGRLGLGASATVLNQQQAQDQKLRNQLLRHTQTHRQPQDDVDEGPMVNRPNGTAANANDEGDEEDEDSRSAAIRSRALASDQSTRTTKKKGKTIPASFPSMSPTIDPLLASGASIPSTSFYDKHPACSNLASTSTLATSTTATSAPPDGNGAKLTKNQRKKERDREKARLLKLQAIRESQRAEKEEGIEKKRGIGDVEDAIEERIAEGKKKTKMEKAGNEEGSSDEDDNDDDDEGPFGNGEGSPNGGTQSNKKKKKQRRKKKKGGPSPSSKQGGRVLNLGK